MLKGGKTIQCKNTFFFFCCCFKWRNFSCLFFSEAKLLWEWNTNNFEARCGFLWMLNLVSACFVSIKHSSGCSRVKHAGAHRFTPSIEPRALMEVWVFDSQLWVRDVGTLTCWLNSSGWLCDIFDILSRYLLLLSHQLFARSRVFPSPPLPD